MEKKIDTTIRCTTDLSKFKFLEDNRDVTTSRVNKIIASIEKVGYVLSPILVNEKYEVIDGQGRFLALKKLGLPQYYIMQEGIGIAECRQMNIHQSNWTTLDYIISYAKGGNENYKRLHSLINLSKLPYGITIGIAKEFFHTMGSASRNMIAKGRLQLTEEQKERARWRIQYAEQFMQEAKRIGGHTEYFYLALGWSYDKMTIDQRNRLAEVIKKNVFNFPSFGSVVEYLKYFDAFYNEGIRKNKLKLELTYRGEEL